MEASMFLEAPDKALHPALHPHRDRQGRSHGQTPLHISRHRVSNAETESHSCAQTFQYQPNLVHSKDSNTVVITPGTDESGRQVPWPWTLSRSGLSPTRALMSLRGWFRLIVSHQRTKESPQREEGCVLDKC